VLQRKDSRDDQVRIKVIEIIPTLAHTFSATFAGMNSVTAPQSFLNFTFKYLMDMITAQKNREHAYISLGKFYVAMNSHVRGDKLIDDIFNIIVAGFRDTFCVESLKCLSIILQVSVTMRKKIDQFTIDMMFRGGLNNELIDSLKIVMIHVPTAVSLDSMKR
jgi:hypothetical protein